MIAGRIKNRRVELHMTQRDLAAALQVEQGRVSAWETGRDEPGARKLIALSKALRCSVDWLLGLTDQIDPR